MDETSTPLNPMAAMARIKVVADEEEDAEEDTKDAEVAAEEAVEVLDAVVATLITIDGTSVAWMSQIPTDLSRIKR